MKCKVIREFNDAQDGVLRKEGEVFEATAARINEINSAGYGELVEKIAAPKKATKKD